MHLLLLRPQKFLTDLANDHNRHDTSLRMAFWEYAHLAIEWALGAYLLITLGGAYSENGVENGRGVVFKTMKCRCHSLYSSRARNGSGSLSQDVLRNDPQNDPPIVFETMAGTCALLYFKTMDRGGRPLSENVTQRKGGGCLKIQWKEKAGVVSKYNRAEGRPLSENTME
jgi:hypothetical protein